MKKDAQLKAWCDILQQTQVAEEVVPEGWLTSRQLAEQWNTSWVNARYRLSSAKAKGLVEERKFRVATTRGPYPVPHYRPKA
jgi:hypothetical protein